MVQIACAEFGYGMIFGVSPDALYGIGAGGTQMTWNYSDFAVLA
jgi:hypothetical protein